MRKPLTSLFVFLGLLVGFGATQAHAQIVGSVEAKVDFAFYAGSAKFPAGKYFIRTPDENDPGVMEIRSADGRHAALFQVITAEAKTNPVKTELIFNKYGDKYFLSEIFDEGNKYGSESLGSHYEKMLIKNGERPEKRHDPARHHPKAS